jgi:hypothetical protein
MIILALSIRFSCQQCREILGRISTSPEDKNTGFRFAWVLGRKTARSVY